MRVEINHKIPDEDTDLPPIEISVDEEEVIIRHEKTSIYMKHGQFRDAMRVFGAYETALATANATMKEEPLR